MIGEKHHYDAIVLGSGVGGMCTAALLAHAGRRVLLAEKRAYLGGRFSTVDRDGYRCATGGLAVPVGHNLDQICSRIGIPSGVKPSTRVGTWLDGRIYDLKEGGTRRIIRDVAVDEEESRRVISALNRATSWLEPENNLSFRDWLGQYTSNRKIHGIFQATISSLLTVNSNELPAGEYFRMIRVISPLTFGFIEGGSLSLWERMAELVRKAGGEVWTGAAAQAIEVNGSAVSSVLIRSAQRDVMVSAPVVVSNLGPRGTAALVDPQHMEKSYLAALDVADTPTAIMWLHFCSDEPLLDYSAIAVACSRRVNMIDMPSLEADGVAPKGKHLYTVGAAPLDSLDPGDIKLEFAEVMKDLNEIIPDFEKKCTVLSKTCYRGKWPGFRTVPGHHMGHRTPVENLYNVGDGACPSGYEGSMGAAKSAQMVCEDVLARSPGITARA